MRKFLIFLVVVLAIIGAGLYFLYSNLGTVVAFAIEQGGSSAMETTVDVEGAEVSLEEGRASITGLTIGIPGCYSDGMALTLRGISVAIDANQTNQNLVTITELRVDEPIIAYELGSGKSNLDTLAANLDRNVGGGDGSSSSDDGPKFVVQSLVIEEGSISVAGPTGEIASSKLPAIRIDNIGSESGGVTGAELGEIVLKRISNAAAREATQGKLKDALGGSLGGVGDRMRGIFD